MPELDTDTQSPTVSLRVNARTGWVGMLRGVAAHVATAAGLALDEVEDIRLAIDESYACLLATVEMGTDVAVEFHVAPGVVRCALTGTGRVADRPVLNDLSEALLRCLVHELHAESCHEGPRVLWVYRSAQESS